MGIILLKYEMWVFAKIADPSKCHLLSQKRVLKREAVVHQWLCKTKFLTLSSSPNFSHLCKHLLMNSKIRVNHFLKKDLSFLLRFVYFKTVLYRVFLFYVPATKSDIIKFLFKKCIIFSLLHFPFSVIFLKVYSTVHNNHLESIGLY